MNFSNENIHSIFDRFHGFGFLSDSVFYSGRPLSFNHYAKKLPFKTKGAIQLGPYTEYVISDSVLYDVISDHGGSQPFINTNTLYNHNRGIRFNKVALLKSGYFIATTSGIYKINSSYSPIGTTVKSTIEYQPTSLNYYINNIWIKHYNSSLDISYAVGNNGIFLKNSNDGGPSVPYSDIHTSNICIEDSIGEIPVGGTYHTLNESRWYIDNKYIGNFYSNWVEVKIGLHNIMHINGNAYGMFDTSYKTIYVFNSPKNIIKPNSSSFCSNITTSFTSQIGNCDSILSYQWYKNSVVVSNKSSNVYTDSNLVSGDSIWCVAFCKNLCSSYEYKKSNIVIIQIDTSAKYLAGNLRTPTGKLITNTKLKITGIIFDTLLFSNKYLFNCLVQNSNYTIRPSKNNDIKKNNGVSSIDVILVQNHILNKIKLNSPYKIIAADVNNNKSISNIDVIFMKRLILGIDTAFTGNRLWAFVDSSYQFPDTTNPFPYKDSISFTNLTSNKTNQTFIGVKLGDVNYDWNPALARGVAAKPMELVYELRSALKVRPDGKKGTDFQSDLIHIPISVKNFKDLNALQYTLNFNHKNYEFVGIENNKLGIEFNEKQAMRKGSISFLWADTKGEEHSLEDGNEIFTVVFKSKLGISNDEFGLSLSNDITEIEAWDKDYQQHHIILTQRETKNDKQETKNELFVIYPNPTHSTIKIELNNLVGAGTVVITDVYGKIVFKKNINQPVSTVNTLGFAKGVYLVSVIGEQRKQTQKLIVE